MKRLLPSACALLLLSPALNAQQAIPESPSLWREVTGVKNDYATGVAVPKFTRPHVPGYRTSMDGRIATAVEGSGPDGGTPRFTLLMPEKMTQPFLLNPEGSYTMSSPTVTRINVLNSFGDPALSYKNFTIGGAGVSHVCMWDAGGNPTAVNNEDVYNLQVFVTSNNGTNKTTQFFVTPIQVTVTNPKTVNASIRLIAKTGATVGGPVFPFTGAAFEPVICGDGRLLITRVGSNNLSWTDPVTQVVHPAQGVDIVYSYYPSGGSADVTQWTNLIPITHAPYDSRINTKFGFAMAPFVDPEGTLIGDGEDIGGSYPWIDREAKNLFFETVFDQLHYLGADGTFNYGRYAQTKVPEDPADYTQGEDGGKHQGVSFVGLWSHGKVVMLDNLLNDVDYAVGQGDSSATGGTSTGPQSRMVSLYQPATGPVGDETGWLRMGYGRATKKMPAGENDNGNIIDSVENIFNYRQFALPLSLRDVTWLMSDSKQADELAFDDYLDPNAFIIANMAGLITFPSTAGSTLNSNNFKHWSGWNSGTAKTFDQPVKLQNAATATPDKWVVPKNGLVLGKGRLEPAANGGFHGKGFWMDGTIGLEFTVDAQPQSVASKDWYIGLFVDSRFPNDTTERRLVTFPDGSSIRLYGRSQVLYADATGAIVSRITLPLADTTLPASAMDELLPDTGWTHLAFQVKSAGTRVDFYLDGMIFNHWADDYLSLFQFTPGKLTLGRPASTTVTGFNGWLDDFKVIAHAVDFETACNHAGGTLIGIPSAYTGAWKTKFANRFPSWAHAEISAKLTNSGQATYPQYAAFHDYQHDNSAHRFTIPAGTTGLRDVLHFPEGPLYQNAPRPDSATNAFCVTCHQPGGDAGLTPAALTLNSALLAPNDPRRQPMQSHVRIYGQIPAGLVDSTGKPTTATSLPAGGQLIDQWTMPSFANSTTAKSFTIMDPTTRQDLMTLTAGATVDPAKLGLANVAIRANLNTTQGSVTLQYDTGGTNVVLKPPFNVFGTTANPWLGAALTPGTHTVKATPQYGAAFSVTFTVVANSSRVVAGYRTDFRSWSPNSGWTYLWNALGPITSAANYRALNWSPTINRWSVNGFPVSPDNSSTLFPYGGLTSSGGHPGRGTAQGAVYDRFPIAAYTAKLAGYYGINNSFVTSSDPKSNGGQVVVYVETNNAQTFTAKTGGLYGPAGTLNFNQNVGFMNKGDTIYVGVGPNTHDGSDSFQMDFSIVFNETANPLP